MDLEKRRKLNRLIRSVLPTNPGTQVVETFFGSAIAANMPTVNSVRELAEWIIDCLLQDPAQLKATLHKLDDDSPEVAELLAWAEKLEVEGPDFSESTERPLTSRERFDRRLKIVQTGATVFGGVGTPLAILYASSSFRGPESSLSTSIDDGGSIPSVEISPREDGARKTWNPEANLSESAPAQGSSKKELVQLAIKSAEGENLDTRAWLVEPEEADRVLSWIRESDTRGGRAEDLVIEGYLASSDQPAGSQIPLDPVNIRYQGPDLVFAKDNEGPDLVAVQVEATGPHHPPTDPGPNQAGMELSQPVLLVAVSLLGALIFNKASSRIYRVFAPADES